MVLQGSVHGPTAGVRCWVDLYFFFFFHMCFCLLYTCERKKEREKGEKNARLLKVSHYSFCRENIYSTCVPYVLHMHEIDVCVSVRAHALVSVCVVCVVLVCVRACVCVCVCAALQTAVQKQIKQRETQQ